MDFIDLKTQQKRIKETLDANIQKVLAHGNYIVGPQVRGVRCHLKEQEPDISWVMHTETGYPVIAYDHRKHGI